MSKPLIHDLIERVGNLTASVENINENASLALSQIEEARSSLAQIQDYLNYADNETSDAYDYVDRVGAELNDFKQELAEIAEALEAFRKEDDVEDIAAAEGLEADIRRYKDRVMQHPPSVNEEAVARNYGISVVLVRCIRSRFSKAA